MKENEIIEGNKLIAEFDNKDCHLMKSAEYPDGFYYSLSKGHGGLEPLQYHSSYDWLMPVWFKFIDLKFTEMKDMIQHSNYKQAISHSICYEDLLNANALLATAIKWYNTQTK